MRGMASRVRAYSAVLALSFAGWGAGPMAASYGGERGASDVSVGVSGATGGTDTSPGTSSAEDLGGMPSSMDSQSLGSLSPAKQGSGNAVDWSSDQARARDAVGRGIVRPYGWLLRRLKKAVPGDVVKVRLKQHGGDLWTYDVTVLSESGRYVQVSLDAATGRIVSRKNR